MALRKDEKRQASAGLGPFRGCRREISYQVAIKKSLLVAGGFSRRRQRRDAGAPGLIAAWYQVAAG